MKCIVLVGGYAKRMYPLTQKTPKALLEVNGGGVTVLDIILQNIMKSTDCLDEYILITNDTFYDDFVTWKQESNYESKIRIISDGSITNEQKKGAVSAFAQIVCDYKIDDDIFLVAGDNILDFDLQYIFDEFLEYKHSCIMYYEEKSKRALQKTGVIELDEQHFVKDMEEKPKYPKSRYAVPPFYWLTREDVKLLTHRLCRLDKVDAMGIIIQYLCEETKIKAIRMRGSRYDIGSIEEYFKIAT